MSVKPNFLQQDGQSIAAAHHIFKVLDDVGIFLRTAETAPPAFCSFGVVDLVAQVVTLVGSAAECVPPMDTILRVPLAWVVSYDECIVRQAAEAIAAEYSELYRRWNFWDAVHE